jgi:protein TonB
MPHALLLSPDDQAVSAITGVLEEMSVTCERPLDGVSAAQKLNSQSFDLVLVDCENLPAAKLIFDVCRRGKNGNNPVPIAIVDGRAGLPTAFRLGAELILTKPVAKDQARSTIRTAVSRVRKDAQTIESAAAQTASADVYSAAQPGAVITSAGMSEERTQAAAAASVSSQLTNFAEATPSFAPTFVPAAALTATISAPALTREMHSVLDVIDATPKLNPQSESRSASSLSGSSLSEPSLSEPSPDRAVSAKSKPARPLKPSDDPVLAELERAELEESQLAEAQLEGSKPESSILESSGLGKAAPNQLTVKTGASLPSPYRQGQQRRRAPLVALLMLLLAGGGFYALWTYQPGFRDLAQPQIDRVVALAGMALPPNPASNPVKPSVQLAPATPSAPAPESPADSNETVSKATDSATSSPNGSGTTSVAATVPLQLAASPSSAVAPPASAATTAAAPVVIKPEINKPTHTPADSKKDAAAATSSSAPLPGESSAIILSSKGAEKRLAHSVPPKYPVEARSGAAQGTVVLKAVVDETGKVEGLRLVEGNATLATAAIHAVMQWRYRPYVRDGKAQTFQTVVIVDFQRP